MCGEQPGGGTAGVHHMEEGRQNAQLRLGARWHQVGVVNLT